MSDLLVHAHELFASVGDGWVEISDGTTALQLVQMKLSTICMQSQDVTSSKTDSGGVYACVCVCVLTATSSSVRIFWLARKV